jgi:hypothetical protein
MVDTEEQVQAMVAFISRDVLRGAEPDFGPDTPLFSSGLLDSMTVVDVLHHLGDVTARRIPVGRLKLSDVDTVRLMVGAAHRIGQPR